MGSGIRWRSHVKQPPSFCITMRKKKEFNLNLLTYNTIVNLVSQTGEVKLLEINFQDIQAEMF